MKETIENTQLMLDGKGSGQYVCQCCGDLCSSLRNVVSDIHVCHDCEQDYDNACPDGIAYIVYIEDENGEKEDAQAFYEIEDAYEDFKDKINTHAWNADEYDEPDFGDAFDNGSEVIGSYKVVVEELL